jgi:hypothetical protein
MPYDYQFHKKLAVGNLVDVTRFSSCDWLGNSPFRIAECHIYLSLFLFAFPEIQFKQIKRKIKA